MEYLKLAKLTEVTKEHLTHYWDRKNRLTIVRFNSGHCLVFLVEDCEKPEVPGYPATSIEYFDTHKEAVEAVKECYKRVDYTPKFGHKYKGVKE